MRRYEEIAPTFFDDIALLIDTLEHISKQDGHDLLSKLQARFRKILVFTPLGFMEQDHDVWGMGNPHQIHVSGWSVEELVAHGFECVADPGYHVGRGGAIFAVWERSRGAQDVNSRV
jgi:hypothetical protein